MNQSPFSVIIVGSYVQDHVWLTDEFPKPGETRRALGFSTGPGGKGFNQAIACVRQGGHALFLGAIGADDLGRIARTYAAQEGLTCEWLEVSDVPTAAAGILVDANGANQIMVNLAANEQLSTHFLQSRTRLFAGARVLLVQLENNLDAVEKALELGRQCGLMCVLNPAPMHAGIDARLLAHCDLITPNETEFAQLVERISGHKIGADQIATMADADLHHLCRTLGVASVVITLGGEGCFVSHAAGNLHGDRSDSYRVAAESVNAIDTTGAGDSFSGALVAMLSRPSSQAFITAVRHANRVAAMSTEKPGAALAIPRYEEVVARFGADS